MFVHGTDEFCRYFNARTMRSHMVATANPVQSRFAGRLRRMRPAPGKKKSLSHWNSIYGGPLHQDV